MKTDNISYTIHHGDCLEILKTLPDNSIDSIITDPPYGLSFMGKKWDYDVPSEDIWRECLRVLKPGGHLLAFAGTRTQHRMAVRIEDAGFEIRDMIAWVYGSGFPKSLDVSKAIDKAAGAEREKIRVVPRPETSGTMAGSSDTRPWIEKSREVGYHEVDGNTPVTDSAKQWHGWGTALKPALEPITVARKPFASTVADNVLQHGTGVLNVDGCRVEGAPPSVPQPEFNSPTGRTYGMKTGEGRNGKMSQASGRWPANLIHDGSEEVVELFPATGPARQGVRDPNGTMGYHGGASGLPGIVRGHNDNGGSAARFFYCAKASKADRDEGCEGLEERARPPIGSGIGGQPNQQKENNRNHHPTVKPTDLMRYLCRLVTPPGGVVLDPFAGSGSTGKAAVTEDFNFIGIEREAEYIPIIHGRIKKAIEDRLEKIKNKNSQ